MGLDKAGLKLITAWAKTSEKSLLATKPVKVNIEGLRLAPQLEGDLVQASKKVHSYEGVFTREMFEEFISAEKTKTEMEKELNVSRPTVVKYLEKFGLYEPKTANTPGIIPRTELQEVVDKELSLNQMAAELNVPVGKVIYYLNKYKMVSNSQQEFRILKEYFSATTAESKAKAFDTVDKYLQQIAKDEFKLSKGTTYEDCLQDVRLRFFEEVEKSQKNGVAFPYSILRKVKASAPELEQGFQTTTLEALEKEGLAPAIEDAAIRNFEEKGYRLGHNRILHSGLIYEREAEILDRYYIQGKSFEEIGKSFDLLPERVRQIKTKALERLQKKLAPYKDRL